MTMLEIWCEGLVGPVIVEADAFEVSRSTQTSDVAGISFDSQPGYERRLMYVNPRKIVAVVERGDGIVPIEEDAETVEGELVEDASPTLHAVEAETSVEE